MQVQVLLLLPLLENEATNISDTIRRRLTTANSVSNKHY